MRYRSKLDTLTSLILLLPVMSSIFRLTSVFLASYTINWSEIYFLLFYMCILIFLYISIYYEITKDTLIVSNLFLKTHLPISTIKKVSKTRTFLSAPALSLDRIKIECHKKSIVISPERREQFLSKLSEINPQIKITLNK
ncbi:PH domain-containing protein [Halobacteriovorax sp. RZ-1]|uniref:PH domain-containing protein n=1 Tax=unclassified Halobacteriovorax TaxID=2639665 RepID=UPI0037187315